jgi:hypothetical protein
MNTDEILSAFLKYANMAYVQPPAPPASNIQQPIIQSGQPPKRILNLDQGAPTGNNNGNSLSKGVKPATNPNKLKI